MRPLHYGRPVVLPPLGAGEDRTHGLLRGRSGGKRLGPATSWVDYFPSAAAAI
ncbi:hypothetical protein ABIB82_007717 [Bradyrhizobium sp. i1.8.4]